MATDAEILAALEAAYVALLEGGAQSYSINGRTWTGLNLKDLSNEISRWRIRVNASTRRPALVKFKPVTPGGSGGCG